MTLADLVLYVHFAYVAAVVLPVPLILLGARRGWRWVRHRGVRSAHLAMMGLVFAETLLGVVCPLTWLERALRGEHGEQGFLSAWVSRLLFYDLPPEFFAAAYCAFFAGLVALWWVVPVARKETVPPARKETVPLARKRMPPVARGWWRGFFRRGGAR